MYICNGKVTHEEIVHAGWDCPLCTALSDHDTKRTELICEIGHLREQLDRLNDLQRYEESDPSEDRVQTP